MRIARWSIISDFGQGSQYLDARRRYVHLQATGRHDGGRPESEAFIDRVRNELGPRAGFPPGTDVYVGGSAAFGVDFVDKTYSTFPFLVAAVLLLTYILLLRAFRSLLLPLKAIVLNVLSITATYGLLVAAFKWGWGDPLGLIEYEQITAWIPVFLFAMLFGLSMDYEVFLSVACARNGTPRTTTLARSPRGWRRPADSSPRPGSSCSPRSWALSPAPSWTFSSSASDSPSRS